MATVAIVPTVACVAAVERRRALRVSPTHRGCLHQAVLRPGVDVRVVDICPFGALVESPTRLRPGIRTELQLLRAEGAVRTLLPGRVARCLIVCLKPLRYHGAIAFDAPFDDTFSDG